MTVTANAPHISESDGDLDVDDDNDNSDDDCNSDLKKTTACF